MNGTVVVRWRERERKRRGERGSGGNWGGGWVVGGVGGTGLFMMPSPINTAEVMTQIVLPLHAVSPADSRPLLLDTPLRRQRQALCSLVKLSGTPHLQVKKIKSGRLCPSIHLSTRPPLHPSISPLSSVVNSRLLAVFNGCVLLPSCVSCLPRWSSHCVTVQSWSAGSLNLLLN